MPVPQWLGDCCAGEPEVSARLPHVRLFPRACALLHTLLVYTTS